MKKILWTGWLALGIVLFSSSFYPISTVAETESADFSPLVYVFGREDCAVCKQLISYLDKEKIDFTYLNVKADDSAKLLYDQITLKHGLTKVTPIIVINETVIVGFNGAKTTGKEIKTVLKKVTLNREAMTIEDHIANAPVQSVTIGANCSDIECEAGESKILFDLPFFGVIDLQSFSLFTLSLVLGVIDGFNPCAMWVLITFLVLLSQAGSKKKMILLASIFVIAEAVMYNLILNVWYKTWDFVSLDEIVTPLVGFLALGGGIFFLWRWHKNKDAQLVCDITDIETQSKTINKFRQVIESPVTIASIAAILVIAFSVNIIEFACSIGIPQAYTKILELNGLAFLERQWYILIYTAGYMFDDLIVFALAIWGYSKLQSHGGKYAQWSLLIGGLLMLILGSLLVFNPSLLVW